jgi:hypothetical protein
MNRNQQAVIEYLREEVRVLKEQLADVPGSLPHPSHSPERRRDGI